MQSTAYIGNNRMAMLKLWRSLAWRVLLAFGLVAGPWPMVVAASTSEPLAHEQARSPCHDEAPAQTQPDCCDHAGCFGDACGSALCGLAAGVAPPVPARVTEAVRVQLIESLVREARAPPPLPAQNLRPPIA